MRRGINRRYLIYNLQSEKKHEIKLKSHKVWKGIVWGGRVENWKFIEGTKTNV